jgi:SSS family solute:Na+ symporter
MQPIDWLLMVLPLVVALGAGFYARRYVRSVADFMAGGRAAGRYLLCTAKGEMGAGAVMFVGLFEVFSKSGFTTTWWQHVTVPVGLIVTITGFVVYRYRQTRAMTLAQFFEMRYSRRIRLFTGALGFIAGLLNFGIIPCIGARFFVYFLDLPQSLRCLGHQVPTYLILMACFLSASSTLIIFGGQVAVLVTNCLEGMFSQICYVIVAIALVATFSWSSISHVLLAQPAGHSMVNPFDSFATSDFNVWWVLMGVSFYIYGTMAWQNSHAFNSSAATPHDSRMGGLLSNWKAFGLSLVVTLLAACAVTYLNHPDYANGAAAVRNAAAKISDKNTAQQMLIPIALAHLLPVGIKGLVCAIIVMGVISGDAIHLHSWSSIFIQDVVLPLRKTPMPLGLHLLLLRLGAFGVALFAFCFGALFHQTEYILMWFQVTTAIYVGGAGAIIIGGLYWSRGTTWGAWAGLLTGSILATAGILFRQFNSEFPLNGAQISFFSAIIAMAAYIGVSLLTCREPQDMDRLLHRGKYAMEPEGGATGADVLKRLKLSKIIGIDEHFTLSDRIIAYAIFWWSILWCFVFAIGSVTYLIHPWSNQAWATYWHVSAIWVPLVITILTTIWFTVGCAYDLRLFFKRLRAERVDISDDGTVGETEPRQAQGVLVSKEAIVPYPS